MYVLARGVTFLVLSAALAGCGGMPSSPSPQGPLTLTGQATRTVLSHGDTAVVTFTLHNVSNTAVHIDSPDSCVLLPYVFDRRAGRVVSAAGACALVVTSIDLPAGASRTLDITIHADAVAGSDIGLGPGEYWVYARLHDERYNLQSQPITVTIS